MHWRYLYAGLVLAFLSATPAIGCSVTSDYVRPTNYELVQIADAIVVATATKDLKKEDPFDGVEFRVDKVVKGQLPASTMFAAGSPSTTEYPSTPSDPNDISGPNPEAYAGACNRTLFTLGRQYVVFLAKNDDGGYRELGIPFSRVNEDYFGDDSLWIRTIRSYLEIQNKYGAMEQLDVLDTLLQQKLKAPQTPEIIAQATDILDHLRSRSPWKPTAFLVKTFETLERGEEPKYGVRSPAADREMSPAQDLTDALIGQRKPPDKLTLEQEKIFVLRSLVLGNHPVATPLFDRLLAAPQVPPRVLGLGIRFHAKNSQYRRAYGFIETQAMRILGAISAGEALELISDILDAQRGGDYRDGHERWRSDPYVRVAWPELALHLYWFSENSFGHDATRADFEAIQAIPIKDYRERPLVTLAIASNFNEAVQKWAGAELQDEAKRLNWESKKDYDQEDPALLPMQVMARSYGDGREKVLRNVACQSEARRELLITALGDWGGSLDQHWFAELASREGVSDFERDLIGKALARLYAREAAKASEGGLLSSYAGNAEYELLEKLVRREPLTVSGTKVEPLRCSK